MKVSCVNDAVANGTFLSVAAQSVVTQQNVCHPIAHNHIKISIVQCHCTVCTANCLALTLKSKLFKLLQSSGHYMYRQFNITQFYVLPTQCICVDLSRNSGYFPTQH